MRLSLIGLVAAAAMLVGCASDANKQTHRVRSAHEGLDYQKMAAVERMAQGRGVRVIWINPPSSAR